VLVSGDAVQPLGGGAPLAADADQVLEQLVLGKFGGGLGDGGACGVEAAAVGTRNQAVTVPSRIGCMMGLWK